MKKWFPIHLKRKNSIRALTGFMICAVLFGAEIFPGTADLGEKITLRAMASEYTEGSKASPSDFEEEEADHTGEEETDYKTGQDNASPSNMTESTEDSSEGAQDDAAVTDAAEPVSESDVSDPVTETATPGNMSMIQDSISLTSAGTIQNEERILTLDGTEITDFTKDHEDNWTLKTVTIRADETYEVGYGWRYSSEDDQLVISGGEEGYSVSAIESNADLTIATAGLVMIGSITVDGDLYLPGSSVLIIDKLLVSGSVYCDEAAIFLKDSGNSYVLRTDAELNENICLPAGETFVIPSGRSLSLMVFGKDLNPDAYLSSENKGKYSTCGLRVPEKSKLILKEGASLWIDKRAVAAMSSAACSLEIDGLFEAETGSDMTCIGEINVSGTINLFEKVKGTAEVNDLYKPDNKTHQKGIITLDFSSGPNAVSADSTDIHLKDIHLSGKGKAPNLGDFTLSGPVNFFLGTEPDSDIAVNTIDAKEAKVFLLSNNPYTNVTILDDKGAAFEAVSFCSCIVNAKNITASNYAELASGFINITGSFTAGTTYYTAADEAFGYIHTRENADAPQVAAWDTDNTKVSVPVHQYVAKQSKYPLYTSEALIDAAGLTQGYIKDFSMVTGAETASRDWSTLFDSLEIPDKLTVGETEYSLDAFLVYAYDQDGDPVTRYLIRGSGKTISLERAYQINTVYANKIAMGEAASSTVTGVCSLTGSGILGGSGSLQAASTDTGLGGNYDPSDDDGDDNSGTGDDNGSGDNGGSGSGDNNGSDDNSGSGTGDNNGSDDNGGSGTGDDNGSGDNGGSGSGRSSGSHGDSGSSESSNVTVYTGGISSNVSEAAGPEAAAAGTAVPAQNAAMISGQTEGTSVPAIPVYTGSDDGAVRHTANIETNTAFPYAETVSVSTASGAEEPVSETASVQETESVSNAETDPAEETVSETTAAGAEASSDAGAASGGEEKTPSGGMIPAVAGGGAALGLLLFLLLKRKARK